MFFNRFIILLVRVLLNCALLKLTGRLGLSTQNNPRNANSFVLRVEALLSGIVLGGQTQSLREFQEWAIVNTPNSYSLERAWSRGIVDRTKEYFLSCPKMPRLHARSRPYGLGVWPPKSKRSVLGRTKCVRNRLNERK